MKLSELSSLLTKVQSIAGDVDVVLRAAEGDLETVISDLVVHIDPTTGSPESTLAIVASAAAS